MADNQPNMATNRILSLIGLGYNATSLTPIGRALLAVYAVSLGTHILLIIAVVKAIRPLLLAWVIVTIICTIAALAIYIYLTDVEVTIINRLAAIGFFGWNVSKTGLTLIWIYWGALLIMTVYGCLVVFSHYQNLREAARGQGQQQMVVMGNQAYMAGNQAYMAGNQAYIPGNQAYMAGNQAYIPGNQAYIPGNQAYMAGNQAYMVGNQPAKVANRPTASYGFL
ncbi:PREDICTED: uncharacterized protein LOC109475702 [Branchiostoma belcheri]|uniref:Uncharacterized protein LOC109475702 n=1 Tax=Branchiostoma belcheri TaxID=7741 RepID=A0A6P4ZLU8_BRABE|nr:PREDICTED: uncharacterized protein LOC109475702 [Branchiostoma belcheri]